MDVVLFVKQIPLWVKAEQLMSLFSEAGTVLWVRMFTLSSNDEWTCALVAMARVQDAEIAIQRIDGQQHFGVRLGVERLFATSSTAATC